MTIPQSVFRICVLMMTAVSCSSWGGDDYIRSLGLKPEGVVSVKILDLEDYDIYKPRQFACMDGIFYVSRLDGGYNISIIDSQSKCQVNVLQRGRGPGEVFQGSSLHLSAGRVYFNDSGNAKCLEIRFDRAAKTVFIDTVARFSSVGARPYYMCKAGDNFISGNSLNPDCWYALYDNSGKVTSEVEALSFPELKTSNADLSASMMLSSVYGSDHDGTRICVANVLSASLSFAIVKDGKIDEYKRIQYMPPKIQGHGFSPESHSCFNAVSATNDAVFVLYSGRTINDPVPCDECEYLVRYSWEGTPERLYRLSQSLSAICCSEGQLYGLSSYPSPQLFIVPDIER